MNHQATNEIKINTYAQGIRAAIALAIAVVIGFVAYLGYKNYADSKSEKAFGALYEAEALEEAGVKDARPDSAPKLDALIATWPQEKKDQYEKALNRVLSDYPGSAAAHLAGLKLGRYQFGLNKVDAAEKAFSTVADKASATGMEVVYKVLALEALGTLHESQQQFDRAFENFKKAADLKDNPLKPLSYLSAARALRSQGKDKEAQDYYQKVITEFPNSDYEKQARALMSFKAAGKAAG